MYLTSFIHREELFDITERWLCARPEPDDGRRITQILICDGFVAGEMLEAISKALLGMVQDGPFRNERIQYKGELRDAICRSARNSTSRVEELMYHYQNNPDFFYREAPIDGFICLDRQERLLGLYRIKRPRRIAEKANLYIATGFCDGQKPAQKMAEERAWRLGIPVERLLTPPEEMGREFVDAEQVIAENFKQGSIELDRSALTIDDVAGMKIFAEGEKLSILERGLCDHPTIKTVGMEEHQGNYRASSLILEVALDKEHICRRYRDGHAWEKYLHRGISEQVLRKGIEPLLDGAKPTINIELILSTFPDAVESELGNCIHEERIIAQRDNKAYKGYIPLNVEFLVEYLFAVGLSPEISVDSFPSNSGKISAGYDQPRSGAFITSRDTAFLLIDRILNFTARDLPLPNISATRSR
jgi:hypothetical protein